MVACTLMLAAASVVVAADECSCAALEKEVRTLRAEMDEVRALLKESGTSERGTERVAVEAALGARRLSSASTYVSVPARQVHEFVDGHSCPNIGGYMSALPVKTTGGISYDPSPSDVTDQISLEAVQNDWSTVSIDASPAPLKIVHDAACAVPPTLELQLNTSVPSLSIGGVDVAVRLAALVATPWAAIGFSHADWVEDTTNGNNPPMYSIMGGIVYMKGGVMHGSGNSMNAGDHVLTLPMGARPSQRVNLVAWAIGGNAAMGIEIAGAHDGRIISSTGGATGFHLDGTYFFL